MADIIIHAGTPQGTGPNDNKLLINDLNFDLPYIRYVDDTSLLSVSDDFYAGRLFATGCRPVVGRV